jgi:regulator of nucleoside diphosphate kinase
VLFLYIAETELESGMTKPTITINELDVERLDTLLAQPAFAGTVVAQALNEELDRAEILPPHAIPADVVTMNSRVRFHDLSREEEHIRTLVYPASLKDSNEQLSVMAPLGAALLGLHVNDEISWKLPGRDETRITVLELLYQPEAAGEYHR